MIADTPTHNRTNNKNIPKMHRLRRLRTVSSNVVISSRRDRRAGCHRRQMPFRFTWSWSFRTTRTTPQQCCYVKRTTFKTSYVVSRYPTTRFLLPTSFESRLMAMDNFIWKVIYIQFLAFPTSIGGLVVKLAVAIGDINSYDSASPGFDSRPMHEPAHQANSLLVFLLDVTLRRRCKTKMRARGEYRRQLIGMIHWKSMCLIRI